MSKQKQPALTEGQRLVGRLQSRLNQGHSRDLLLVLADAMEEHDIDAWLAPLLRAMHGQDLHEPKRMQYGHEWYWGLGAFWILDGVHARLKDQGGYAVEDEGMLLYRRRWDAYRQLAVALAGASKPANATARVKRSGRLVPILIDGDRFWVVRPTGNPGDGPESVSGPFRLDDERFEVMRPEG